MEGILRFLKTVLLGGFVVVLPLMLFIFLLEQALDMLVAMATPIADLLPMKWIDPAKEPVIAAVILLTLLSFIFGLALKSDWMRRAGRKVEGGTLGRLPVYTAVKGLAESLTGQGGDETHFRPALLRCENDEWRMVYMVEEIPNGYAAVLAPRAPRAFSGPVMIVRRERLELLDISLGKASGILGQWGVGVGEVLDTEGGGVAGRKKEA